MQKYSLQKKVFGTKDALYTHAENIFTRKNVIIKKQKTKRNWEQLLNSPEIIFMKQTQFKFIAKIIQIVKQKEAYYIVLEPLNLNLEQITTPIPQKQVISIGCQMLQYLSALQFQPISIPYLKKQHFFLNNKSIKVAHIPTFFDYQFEKKNLSVSDDYRFYPPEKLSGGTINTKSHLFSVGCILSQLLLNSRLIEASTKKDYLNCINKLFPDQKISSVLQQEIEYSHIYSLQQKFKQINPELTSLFKEFLRVDPNKRINLREAITCMSNLENKVQSLTKSIMLSNRVFKNGLMNSSNKFKEKKVQLTENKNIELMIDNKKIQPIEDIPISKSVELPKLKLSSQINLTIKDKLFEEPSPKKMSQTSEKYIMTEPIQSSQISLPKDPIPKKHQMTNTNPIFQKLTARRFTLKESEQKTIYANKDRRSYLSRSQIYNYQ